MSMRILSLVFCFLLPELLLAQVVKELYQNHPDVDLNWFVGADQLNDSSYFVQEYRAKQLTVGFDQNTRLLKFNKRWEVEDSVVAENRNMSLLKYKNGVVYWGGYREIQGIRTAEVFLLDDQLNVFDTLTLDSLPNLTLVKFREIPSGIGLLAIDRTTLYSYLIEIRQNGQSVQVKAFRQGNRQIALVGDFLYLPAKNQYVAVGSVLRSDTLKVGSDQIMQLGLFDTNLEADTLRFISFYPTQGAPLQRAMIVQSQAAQLQLVSDSTFLVFGHGRDLRSIMMNFELALQISVSYWQANLTPLSHFMTGLPDTMDVLSGEGYGRDFQGNHWLGYTSATYDFGTATLLSSKVSLLKLNNSGAKLSETSISRPNRPIVPLRVQAFGDSLLFISGYYYTPNSSGTLLGPDGYFLVLNPFRASSSSVVEAASSLQVQLYPNPATTVVHIALGEEELDEWVLCSFNGQQLKQSRGTTIDVADLPAGIYFYRLQTKSGKRASGKLVLQ
jgi:hypothetical protein